MAKDDDKDDKLSPEEIEMFLSAVARVEKRRRVELLGYAVGLLTLVLGMLAALVVYGMARRGTFMGWVFLVPLGVTGLVLWIFGRWARRITKAKKLPH